jgi:hypothetical protein
MHSMKCEICSTELDENTMECEGEFFVCPDCAQKSK